MGLAVAFLLGALTGLVSGGLGYLLGRGSLLNRAASNPVPGGKSHGVVDRVFGKGAKIKPKVMDDLAAWRKEQEERG